MAKNITMDELLTIIDSLPYNKFKEIIDHYSATNKADFENEMELMVTASLQQKLLKFGINSTCPYCNSDRVIKKGKRKHIQALQYGRRPSKYGVMGPEFATVVTAIDNRGYSVCKVSSLGKLTNELFVDLFEKHLNNPAYICSDANDVYENYCNLFNIPHYEKPSNYVSVLEKNGYETPDWSNPAAAKVTEEKNNKILEKLYNVDMIDKITNRGYMKYKDFADLKEKNGLSLARVNELHSDIKNFIYSEMTNVSTKYLQDYIGYFTYIRNWKVKNGRYPNSQKDTETIFIEILKSRVNYTITEVDNQELELPKPTSRYVTILKEETEKARKATSNRYFKFGEEDGVKTFNKREYLLDQPKSKLYAIAKECKMKHYRQLASKIQKKISWLKSFLSSVC